MSKVLIGVLAAVLATMIVPTDHHSAVRQDRQWLAVLVGPILILVGVFEVLSGVKSTDWITQWPQLPTWLQYVITVVAAVALCALVIVGVVISR